MLDLSQSAVKQLIPQPDSIGVDNVRLAVVRDLLDPALKEISLDIGTIDAFRLSRQVHDLAEFVQRSLGMRGERGVDVAQVA